MTYSEHFLTNTNVIRSLESLIHQASNDTVTVSTNKLNILVKYWGGSPSYTLGKK